MFRTLFSTKYNVKIAGLEPYKKRKTVAQKIGVVFGQKTQLWWDIPLIESFKVLKEIYRISDSDYKERLELLSETLGISDFFFFFCAHIVSWSKNACRPCRRLDS